MPTGPRRTRPGVVAGVRDGIAYTVHLPTGTADGGVVILHGAGSTRENHVDFAERCVAGSLAALRFDMRGHGASGGRLDGRAVADVAAMADLLRATAATMRIGLRGSSMGGWLALAAAEAARATAVVAVCPAPGAGLRTALDEGRLSFTADPTALGALLAGLDEAAAARALGPRLLLVHAEGDEVVPVGHSRALHAAAPESRLVVVPGGHHRSVQHDPDLQANAVAFLQAALGAAPPG